jgi:hypothetical protein
MNFAAHNPVNNTQWNRYRQLELLPNTVPNPASYRNPLTFGLNVVWRSLLALLIDELVEEQRVEYLERCWSLNEFGEGDQSSSNSLQRFWVLIE